MAKIKKYFLKQISGHVFFLRLKLSVVSSWLKLLAGFEGQHRSLLGAYLQRASVSQKLRRLVGLFLVTAFAVTVTFPRWSLGANMGGTLGINTVPAAPRVDTLTRVSARIPVDTIYISRGFSWYHSGMDLVAHYGAPVYPIMDGVVIATPTDWFGYGKHVIVDHGGGFTSLYGHFSKIDVQVGQHVTVNTQIGEVGTTGFSTGPHVHLEVRINNQPTDPSEYLPDTETIALNPK